MPSASPLISSLVVDQHPVAIIDDEPIENVDPVDPDVDPIALDVVMDIPLRKSERALRPVILEYYIIYLQEHVYDVGDISNPTTNKEAIVSPQSNFWFDAIKDELTSMSHNKVWSFVDLLDSCRPIRCKWVFKTKRDAKGQVERCKEKLVAKSYS